MRNPQTIHLIAIMFGLVIPSLGLACGDSWSTSFWLEETQQGFEDVPSYHFVKVRCLKGNCTWLELGLENCIRDGTPLFAVVPTIDVYSTNKGLKVKKTGLGSFQFITDAGDEAAATFQIEMDCAEKSRFPYPQQVIGGYNKRMLNGKLARASYSLVRKNDRAKLPVCRGAN